MATAFTTVTVAAKATVDPGIPAVALHRPPAADRHQWSSIEPRSMLGMAVVAAGAARSLTGRAAKRQLQRRSFTVTRAKGKYWADKETTTKELESGEPAKPPRVRFAPSPTGVLHVGGARTALFNWLFAKSQGGEMILRVEDTDMARSTKESEAAILEGLNWCGITWDEGPDKGGDYGPYRQSERIDAGIYEEQLEKLISNGSVYRCFLTSKELDAMRSDAEEKEEAFVLQSPWSNASKEKVQDMLDKDMPFVWRFRVPYDQEMVVNDMVVGEVIWNSDDLGGDFVIVRQTGVPMYNFGVVVDDALMEITHVCRAQEHLMNTPRQMLIYQALGFEPPKFAHMPLILAPDRSKLSKRHGAVAVGDYQKQGYLASGMVNYLAQLGWNDGTNKEIYNMDELLEAFKMDRMSKVAAVFDKDKFKWVNGNHIRLMDDDQSEEMIGAELVEAGMVKEAKGTFVRKAATLLKERVGTLAEAANELKEMLAYPLDEYMESGCEHVEDGSIKDTADKFFNDADVAEKLAALKEDPTAIKPLVQAVGAARGGVKKKALMRPFRLCLTASTAGPDMKLLFDVMASIDDNVLCDYVPLERRLEMLKEKLEL